MNTKKGFIKVYRAVTDSPMWTERPFDKAHALVDLVSLANYENKVSGGKEYRAGCVYSSERDLSRRWGWSREKVRRFLSDLIKDGFVRKECGKIGTEILIIGYQADETTNETTNETILKNIDNRINNINILSDSEKLPFKAIIDHLNAAAGTNYRHTAESTQRLIKARFNEGFKEADFMIVIDNKVAEWKGDAKMQNFLRPQTLFGTKFESYLNARAAPKAANSFHNFKQRSVDWEEVEKELDKQFLKEWG